FKSFVDPTTLHLPTNLTGIVGPNGCGKSNIIDAVRWVMGESAASRLRGDALTDVIFSGSSARKPVGQAVVELLFDNEDGAIGGEFAQFAEISVKRVVSRDGQSSYSLNGTRCRRRDITDLFLGTGIGPRGYSIIEQGVISEIVESRPEQLRVHLEEAAGISRYKERRKETETRIRHTRENIARINDISEEVQKQLEHLDRQRRAATRWQALQTERSRAEAELHALEYRAIDNERQAHSEALREASLEMERQLAAQRQTEAQLEATRAAHQQAGEHLNAVQAEGYKLGAEIARIEQQISHTRELRERLQRAQGETRQAFEALSRQLAEDGARADELQQAVDAGAPEQQQLQAEAEAAAAALRDSEQRLADWQQRSDSHAGDTSNASRAAEVERTRIDYLDRQSLELGKRRGALEQERARHDIEALQAAGDTLRQEHDAQRAQLEALNAQLEQRKADHERLLEQERALQNALNDARHRLHTGRGRLASLEALQHAALGQDQADTGEWLARVGLDPSRRLGAALTVEDGWEAAVETVLHGLLEAVLSDAPLEFAEQLDAAGAVNLALLDADAGQGATGRPGSLAARVQGPAAALALLSGVRCADSVEQARSMVAGLGDGESVICRGGEWFGRGFVRILRADGGQSGVLGREKEIRQLEASVAALDSQVAELNGQLEDLRRSKSDAEAEREDAQRQAYQAHRRAAELAGALQGHEGKLESARARLAQTEAELAEIAPRLAEIDTQSREARARLEASVAQMGEHEQRRRALDDERRQLLEQREEARLNASDAADRRHRLALSLESRRAELAALQQSLARTQAQLAELEERGKDIAEQLASGDAPVAELDQQRQLCLDQRLLIDRRLVEARQALEQHEATLREQQQARQQLDEGVNALRESHGEKRLAEQALRLQGERLASTISEAGHDLEALLAALGEDADPAQWRSNLETLQQKITRLEPVNLAAIQEHEEQSQRKQYLDAQMADLGDALATLEAAIKKIDRETRARFKETFDKVNAGLQDLFPRLFGGGHAYLELTGEDLLDTGVAIMARPPGKRISSISLMSGGEKAMTAVALVFAIFQLNPAPFCLLDEVDAPLDEANVGRFSSLVAEMSEQVQFIFITHNKSTMEAARQLCGVTMREAGVSRLVQVDLAEASKLAGAAA
ncbi:MAG TPA: chromosome segregation protein SMC, partial [Rhodanobacteraceae bacterium]|nr:chromosome segregation protein SMC [Rhodanobacteraceae bacterium]